jgi:hypothetical protein
MLVSQSLDKMAADVAKCGNLSLLNLDRVSRTQVLARHYGLRPNKLYGFMEEQGPAEESWETAQETAQETPATSQGTESSWP